MTWRQLDGVKQFDFREVWRILEAEAGEEVVAGFDVQQISVNGTPDNVLAEVRYLIDTFGRPDGGGCLAVVNGILPGTPLENIKAFLDEALRYGEGKRVRAQANKQLMS